jgi:hypothetical protein
LLEGPGVTLTGFLPQPDADSEPRQLRLVDLPGEPRHFLQFAQAGETPALLAHADDLVPVTLQRLDPVDLLLRGVVDVGHPCHSSGSG